MKKKYCLWMQIVGLMLSVGIFCGIIFLLLNYVTVEFVKVRIDNSTFQKQVRDNYIEDFQKYITEQNIMIDDEVAIQKWVKGKPMLILEVYRGEKLYFSTFGLRNEEDKFDVDDVPYNDWAYKYNVLFQDGSAELMVYCDAAFHYYSLATLISVVISVILFLLLFLFGCKNIFQYIIEISKEIQNMETGDLMTPITIRGNNELTTLAECLDMMRIAFQEGKRNESNYYEANQALISQMSHDLRTPLTTLSLYTEIIRLGKYKDEEQLQEYLNKIDNKANQIKQLAENILSYSLKEKEKNIKTIDCLSFHYAFKEPLKEMLALFLREKIIYQIDEEALDDKVYINLQYIQRIMDNISSNICRYADKQCLVQINFIKEQKYIGFSFQNKIKKDSDIEESKQIGLSSVQSMMNKMDGICSVEQKDDVFCIALLFMKEEK